MPARTGDCHHSVDAIHHKREPQTQHDAANNRFGCQFGYRPDGPGSAGDKPEKPGGEARSEKSGRADASGNRRRANCLHGLNRKRGSVIEPGRHQGDAEHEKKPERVNFHDRDIGNHKRNQRADITKRPCPLHSVIMIFRFRLGGAIRNFVLSNIGIRFHQ